MIRDFFRQLFSGSTPPAPTPVASSSLSPAEHPKKKREWTVMVYMAGDNGAVIQSEKNKAIRIWYPLEQEGHSDLAEMERVGSSDEVAIVVQFDALSQKKHTYRHIIGPAGGQSQQIQMSNQNMGDPASLSDFIEWGMTEAPAKQYAVILWSHGTGWKEDDIYAYAREKDMTLYASQDRFKAVEERQQLYSGLFRKSAAQIMAIQDNEIRGICYDDSSLDFLDNAELQQAFREAEKRTKQKVSLIGMDACLMSMLEVAYQMRDYGEVMVSSQEAGPADGWPYRAILSLLSKKPTMSAKELGQVIVQEYGKSYNSIINRKKITQSALDLAKIDQLSQALGQLASELERTLVEGDEKAEIALFRAERDVVRFKDKDFTDLHHYLTKLRKEYKGNDTALKKALDHVLQILNAKRQSPVLANVAQGSGLKDARGLSIYCPALGCSQFYDKLDFKDVGWGSFIRRLNRVESPTS